MHSCTAAASRASTPQSCHAGRRLPARRAAEDEGRRGALAGHLVTSLQEQQEAAAVAAGCGSPSLPQPAPPRAQLGLPPAARAPQACIHHMSLVLADLPPLSKNPFITTSRAAAAK